MVGTIKCSVHVHPPKVCVPSNKIGIGSGLLLPYFYDVKGKH